MKVLKRFTLCLLAVFMMVTSMRYDTLHVEAAATDGTAYAVLTNEGDLIFFRSKNQYSNEEHTIVVDVNSKQYTGIVFTDVENGYAGWNNNREQIKKVYVADNTIIAPNDMYHWFSECMNIVSFNSRGFDTSAVTYMSLMFGNCSSLTSLDLSNFDTSNVTNMGSMFVGCESLTSLDLSSFNTSNVTDMSNMFSFCSSLPSLDLSSFDTSHVTDMGGMFSGCSSLTGLDLKYFDTSNVTNMQSMFSGCSGIKEFDLSSFDTSHITDMGGMFSGCSSLTCLDLRNFDTSNVTNMQSMFYDCTLLEKIDLSNFNTSSVVNMSYMFYHCTSLEEIDLSNFITSSVVNMSNMFYRCSSLTNLELKKFDTSNVTNMENMFRESSCLLKLDLSSFDTGSITNMQGMFYKCNSLIQVSLGPHFSRWINGTYLPQGTWRNGDNCFSEKELYQYYQNNYDVLFGTWERDYILAETISFDIYRPVIGVNDSTGVIVNFGPSDTTIQNYKMTSSDPSVAYVSDGSIISRSVGDATITVSTIDGSNLSASAQITVVEIQGTAYGILLSDGDLVFIRSYNHYDSGITRTVTDINGQEYYGLVIAEAEQHRVFPFPIEKYAEKIKRVYVAENTTIYPKAINFMNCINLRSFDSKGFDTRCLSGLNAMFYGCKSLVELDLSYFDTTNAKSMQNVFYGCTSLVKLDISSFDTSNIDPTDYTISMAGLFSNCNSLNEIVLGKGFTKWITESYLPIGNWTNGNVILSEQELYSLYPKNAEQWAGTWYRVVTPAESLSIEGATIDLGDTVSLHYDLLPADANIRKLRWSSSDDSIVSVDENGKVTGLKYGIAKITATTVDGSNLSATCTVWVTDKPVYRIYGENRYETSLKTAEELRSVLGVDKFDAVVLTTGSDFADALSGSYLANKNKAPVILIRDNAKKTPYLDNVINYIKEHVKSNGKVYVLGGVNAVPEEWLTGLAGYKVTRLEGSNRYTTNIEVLNEVGYKGGDILVCTGKDFADSLSASAVDLPILLVNGTGSLSKTQKTYLESLSNVKFHIIGGEAAVSKDIETALASYGAVVERIAGGARYETSKLIAERFFSEPDKAVLAYGHNFPDGLGGGALAYALKSPLILAGSSKSRSRFAIEYCTGKGITSGYVLGGNTLISDDYVRDIFGLPADIVILEK